MDMQNEPQKGTRPCGIAENADLDILYALLRQEGSVSSYTKSRDTKKEILQKEEGVFIWNEGLWHDGMTLT